MCCVRITGSVAGIVAGCNIGITPARRIKVGSYCSHTFKTLHGVVNDDDVTHGL
jgi:hypothetical protein